MPSGTVSKYKCLVCDKKWSFRNTSEGRRALELAALAHKHLKEDQ